MYAYHMFLGGLAIAYFGGRYCACVQTKGGAACWKLLFLFGFLRPCKRDDHSNNGSRHFRRLLKRALTLIIEQV